MKLKKLSLGLAFISVLSFTVVSCGPKDENIKTEIVSAINQPSIMVSVEKGVATISGKAVSNEEKTSIENKVKGVKGVKSVVNNLEVPPPPKVNPDAENKAKIATILKDYPKVVVNVQDGVIYLTGEATKEENKKISQQLHSLNINNVKNTITIK